MSIAPRLVFLFATIFLITSSTVARSHDPGGVTGGGMLGGSTSRPTTKRDAQSGMATGKRMHTNTSQSGKGDTHPSESTKKSVNPETNRGLSGQETGRRALEEKINTRGK